LTVTLHDEAVAIRNARFIIEQEDWSTGRRSEGPWAWVGLLGKGQRPPRHQPWVWGAL